jgi:hypothetical protein
MNQGSQGNQAGGPLDRWLKKGPSRNRARAPTVGGRTPNIQGVGNSTRARIRRLSAYQIPIREIAREVRVSPSRVYQVLEEEGINAREHRLSLLSWDEANRLARELGGFARRKAINGRIYFYAVKSEWHPATPTRKASVRQRSLAYLGTAMSDKPRNIRDKAMNGP